MYTDLSVDIMESSFVNMLRGTWGKRMQFKTSIFLFAFIFIMWNYISSGSMIAYIDFTWIDFFKYVTILMPLYSIGAKKLLVASSLSPSGINLSLINFSTDFLPLTRYSIRFLLISSVASMCVGMFMGSLYRSLMSKGSTSHWGHGWFKQGWHFLKLSVQPFFLYRCVWMISCCISIWLPLMSQSYCAESTAEHGWIQHSCSVWGSFLVILANSYQFE